MKTVAAVLLVSLSIGSAFGAKWIGTISDAHCGPGQVGLPGDDKLCVVFIADDKEVYKLENPQTIKGHIGHEVSITGTLDEEMTIGVSYETQGVLHVESVSMPKQVELTPAEETGFQAWMKGMQPQVVAVRTAILAKDNAKVAVEADKLAAAFGLVADFWQKQNNDNAVHFAADARDSSKVIAGSKVQFEQTMALQKVQAACQQCHLAHRAGSPGAYKIEQ